MTLRTRAVLILALALFVFSVVFTIATLAGLDIPLALIVGAAAVVAVEVAGIVMSLVPAAANLIEEERLTIRASQEATYAALADPRWWQRSPEIMAVDDLVGKPGVVGTRWRTTLANGMVFTVEVVAAEPPARLVIRSRHENPRWPRRGLVIETERTLVAIPAGTELTIRAVMHAVLLIQLLTRLQRSRATRLRRWIYERFRDELEVKPEEPRGGTPS